MRRSNLLEIKKLSFSYGRRDIIDDMSLNVTKGEIVGILGPNGAGKSTLIRLIAGVLRPRLGAISVDDRPLDKFSDRERARLMALVPQENHIPFAYTAMQVVLMGRTPYLGLFGFESSHDMDIARDSMQKTDCLEFASRDINSLSGGERQRVILARALAQGSDILLLDEPTSFLDIKHQLGLHRIVKTLNRENGTTVVCAMHDLNLASSFCDRIILLKNGAIAADGHPREVITAKGIKDTFDAGVRVNIDPMTNLPYCLFENM